MKRFISKVLLLACFSISYAQNTPVSLNRVIAVVGKNMIMESDVQERLLAGRAKGMYLSANGDCEVLEELLYQKLLLSQAERDSIEVTDAEVDNEINRRIRYYTTQVFNSEAQMEEVYKKPISLIKEEMRDDVREQKLEEKMQQKVAGDVKVSPADIRAFYKNIPTDSLPLINSEVEIAQIIMKPGISERAKAIAREKISKIRKSIIEGGESFNTNAILYSEDPGSAPNGGLYEGIQRGQFVPEFEAAAFRLKPGEISEIVETVYGYHIIMLISRKGDFFDARHILITAKMSQEDLVKTKAKMDSVYELVSSGKLKFCEAAAKFSEDNETKMNCGTMMNMNSGNTRFEIEELGQMDDKLVFMLDKMNEGDFSRPVLFLNKDNKQAYRMVMLKTRIAPHKINLKDDYQKLQNLAQSEKQQKMMQDWINSKIESTYIHIDSYYSRCKFTNKWLQAKSPN